VVLVAVVLVAVLGACKVDADVRVGVREDGSGSVTARVALDAAAVRAAEVGGAKLEDAVRLGDLAAAGWEARWVRRRSGGAVLTVTKGFARAADAGAVVAELNGDAGPIRHVRVTRDTSTFTTHWGFTGVADRKDVGTGITADAELFANLSAQRVDVAALDQRVLAQVQEALRLRVTAALPHAAARSFPVPAGTRVAMHTASDATAYGRVLLLACGVTLGVVAIVVAVVGERRSARRRRAGVGSARRARA
jgi:hypothetical protein